MRVESLLIPVLRQVIARERLADLVFGRDPWGNPFSRELNDDPFAVLDVIRADGPVHYKALYRQHFVSGYDETKTVLASSDVLSQPQIDVLLEVRPYTKLDDHARSFLSNFLIAKDPPDHGRLRGLVNRAFTPRQVARLDERMDLIIDDLIEGLDPTAPDVVNDFNVALPVHVICELLGVPRERWPWVREMSTVLTRLIDPFRGFAHDSMNDSFEEFYRYVVELAAERRAEPGDDLMSGLAAAEVEGDRLSEEELVSVFGLILFAGHETTAGMFGNALVALAEFTDQRRWIRDHAEHWPHAIEEFVRYDTPVRSVPRTAARDIELGDSTVPAGGPIALLLAVANRDPRRFDDPDVLDLQREDPAPISFGHGAHYCLGANLARMELRKGMARLLDALGDYTIDESRTEWKQSLTLRGPVHLAVAPG